jgi:hypothetical protein
MCKLVLILDTLSSESNVGGGNPDVSEMADWIRQDGFDVDVVRDVDVARRVVEDQRPDVVIVTRPTSKDEIGDPFVRELRRAESTPSIILLASSDLDEPFSAWLTERSVSALHDAMSQEYLGNMILTYPLERPELLKFVKLMAGS